MVSTKSGVKLLVSEFVDEQEDPFTTTQLKEYVDKKSRNVRTSPNRLAKYVQATGKAESKNKFWVPIKTRPD